VTKDIWTPAHIRTLAPDEVSIPAAREVLRKGGFGTVEPTGDGRGWWVVCRGITDTYQVSVRRNDGAFDCECTCPSYKYPCKHALALLLYLVEHPELRTEAEAPKVAASDFEGLLRAVFRDPDDDTPRLVFADFLEENDQPDRAALIRYQCEQARLKPDARRARELKRLIGPLVAKFKKQIEPLPEGMRCEFRRGFLRLDAHLSHFGDAGALPARVTNLFRDGWVESLATDIYFDVTHSGSLALAARVGELDVSRYALSDELLLAVAGETAEARASGRLARVKVHGRNRQAFERLVRAEHGEAVDLSADLEPVRHYPALTPRTFDLFLRFGRFGGARGLTLNSDFVDVLGDAELSALLTAADLSELRRLKLENWVLTRAGVAALAESSAPARLTELCLEACHIRAAGVTALVTRPLFATLKVLDLSRNTIGKGGVAALLKAPVPPSLRRLVLAPWGMSASEKKQLKAKFGSKLEL
jgi:uncharacterized protein (TIGR02996 family)